MLPSTATPCASLGTRPTAQTCGPPDAPRDGVGALWDLTASMPPGGLPPNAETQSRTLTFRLERAVGYDRFLWAQRQSAVRFEARVFAAKKASVRVTDGAGRSHDTSARVP
jgi:hypothetical protein